MPLKSLCYQELIVSQSLPGGIVHPGQSNTIDTAATVPKDAHPESNRKCGEWYFVKDGDHCHSISIAKGIALADFYFLNPQVDDKCTNLWLHASYCVKAVGDITTYNGYPITTAATVFTRPTPAPTSTTSYPVLTPPALSARASGTVEGCDKYRNAFEYDWGDRYESNACDMWARFYKLMWKICYDGIPVLMLKNVSWRLGKAIAS